MAKSRKYYVISPNVKQNNEEQHWIKFISENGYVCMGWDENSGKAPIFHEQMQKGDIVIIAGKSNANKKVIGFGFVNSNVEDKQLDGMPSTCFYRKLEPFITEKDVLQKLKWDSNSAYGNSSQIPAEYALYPDNNSTDKENIEFLEKEIRKVIMETQLKEKINLLLASKNIILTGAPGTGKTYLAKEIAKQIIGVTTDAELVESGQFEFVQFHPSYDYTDFVEGLRPTKPDSVGNIGFELQDGIFKSFCKKASKNLIDSEKTSEELNKEEVAIRNIKTFLDDCVDEGKTLTLKNGNSFFIAGYNDSNIYVTVPNNAITSKLDLPFDELLSILVEKKKLKKVKDVKDFFKRQHNRQSDSYIFTLYEQKDLNKVLENKTEVVQVERRDYIFVIDEINRGEISKIFGELFFSIDPNYRGREGAVKTQYSNLHNDENEVFYVPENVFIIGSMNDIDRSVDSFDFAMRRRFTWLEITAAESASNMNLSEAAKTRLSNLNNKISEIDGLNSSYHIGGAYFLDSNGIESEDYEYIWNLRIEPLLKEYIRGMLKTDEKLESLKNAFDLNEDN